MKRTIILVSATIVILVIIGILYIKPLNQTNTSNKIQVVAAENFWGSLASQIGGNKANVLSIVSDPNADPHEYESNTTDARAVSSASLVIINGAGYDSWASKLLNASPNSNRRTLDVQTFLDQSNTANPHFWYNPDYVSRVSAQIAENYCQVDAKNCQYYQANYRTLNASLQGYQNEIKQIAAKYSGVKVAATEDIFVYLAKPAGLDLISPASFIQAVAEGNDPPAGSIATFEQQLKSGQVKLLIYNEQTNTPLTTSIRQIAAAQRIPIVGITETIQPVNSTFQSWMSKEISNISTALQKQ
ncbi:MAG TPA: zinc ABC transporter substrate-binding protein [Candidatus Saccharimonadales bacterium]